MFRRYVLGQFVVFREFWSCLLSFERDVQFLLYLSEGVSLLDMKFLDSIGECRFEVGGDVDLNIF